MTRQLFIYPGEVGELVSLTEFARDVHEEAAQLRLRDMREREAHGSGSRDLTDFVAVSGVAKLCAAAADGGRADEVRHLAERILRETAPPLAPLPAFEPDPNLEGIFVRFRAMSERNKGERNKAVMGAVARIEKAYETNDYAARVDAQQELSDARAAFIRDAVAVVAGLSRADGTAIVMGPLTDADLEALQASGLHLPLYEAAAAFQVLPAKKGLRFGLRAGSGSSASSAPDARNTSALTVDAMAAAGAAMAGPPTLLEPHMSQTPAPRGS